MKTEIMGMQSKNFFSEEKDKNKNIIAKKLIRLWGFLKIYF